MSTGARRPDPDDADRIRVVLDYHERTKHRRERYARGPETIDWSSPPRAFRHFDGAPSLRLPLTADAIDVPFSALGSPGAPEAELDLAGVGALLELSFGLSAWKESGPDRWAVRCNPSSGNLHPTEAYVLTHGVAGLPDALWHYDPEHHALELRCPHPAEPGGPAALWVGLSSIHWREAWKYGERAFRYCQLDLGHALGAVRYAAACLGWRAAIEPRWGADEVAQILGLDRAADFEGVEPEDPECLLRVGPGFGPPDAPAMPRPSRGWMGRAQRLDAHPMYRWPVIDAVARASAPRSATPGHAGPPSPDATTDSWVAPAQPPAPPRRAVDLIRQRRSAQAFTRQAEMPQDTWWSMLAALSPDRLPWDVWTLPARVHVLMMVHRVEGVPPGLYALPRSALGADRLRASLPGHLPWARVPGPQGCAPVFALKEAALGATARLLSCTQAIAQDACIAWSFVAEFTETVAEDPSAYRALHREAGLLGQVLYLQAEAHGLRGTGIGCFFDDEVHRMLDLPDPRLQVLYHFSVGRPLEDPRVLSHPPYPDERYAWRPLA